MQLAQISEHTYSVDVAGIAERPKSATYPGGSLDSSVETGSPRVDDPISVGFLEQCVTESDDTPGVTRYQRATDSAGTAFAATPSPLVRTHARRTAAATASTPDLSAGSERQSQAALRRQARTSRTLPTSWRDRDRPAPIRNRTIQLFVGE